MIYTEFEKYCENCNKLEPEVDKNEIQDMSGKRTVNSKIYCKHRQRCESIMNTLKERW